MERDELAGWLRLTLTEGVGNDGLRKLLSAFGLPDAIFGQSAATLEQVVPAAQARALKSEPPELAALLAATLEWLAAPGPHRRRIVTLGDADYPASLLNLADPPPMLYLMGALDRLPQPERAIAIVGSRNPTPQGEDNARQFARALAQAGLTVVSGLALGVDGAAHQGALDGWGALAPDADPPVPPSTIAVIGTGLDRVYPKRHLALAHRIAETGLIVSEFPIGTPPLSHNFPRRNRIIAGLAQGTLVVEAALGSGSLITARETAEQGKDVFAIPGSIHSPVSRGCHALIRQGAKLVESAQDVLEELRWPPAALTAMKTPAPVATLAGDVRPEAARSDDVLLQRMGYDPVSLDALVARTGMDTASLLAALLELELAGAVARLPGGLYQRMATA